MSNDINKTINDTEERLANLDKIMENKIEDREIAMKKGVLQTAIFSLITIATYLVWGTIWYFWIALVLSSIMIGGIIFEQIMLNKAQNKMNDEDSLEDAYENNTEYVELTQTQRHLETLLNNLEEIGEDYGEMYDTDCREQMFDSVYNSLIIEKENYRIPKGFGLFKEEGNDAVYHTIMNYVNNMLPLVKGMSRRERLSLFQDTIYSKSGESQDEFFGWVDPADIEN